MKKPTKENIFSLLLALSAAVGVVTIANFLGDRLGEVLHRVEFHWKTDGVVRDVNRHSD